MTEPESGGRTRRRPMYAKVLRLRHVDPSGWQRAVFLEGSLAVAAILTLSGSTSVWSLLVLPIVVAVVVKGHDLLAGRLRR